MVIMLGFMRKAAIKWIDVYVMSVHFYVLWRNFLEDFREDKMRQFLFPKRILSFVLLHRLILQKEKPTFPKMQYFSAMQQKVA